MCKLSMVIMLAVVGLFKAGHSIGYCDLIGDYIFAQDASPNTRGTYLGLVTPDKYHAESITNQYGKYGSKYNSLSILNEYGDYGGLFSSYSPFNSYASYPPIIWSRNSSTGLFTAVAYLSTNKYLSGTTADPNTLFSYLNSGTCGGTYVPPVSTLPDLVVDSITASRSDNGDTITVRYVVKNIGGISAPAFTVSAEIAGIAIPDHNFSSLKAGYYYSRTFSRIITHDTTSVVLWVDMKDLVVENSEDNNLSYDIYLTPIKKTGVAPRSYKVLPRNNSGKWFDPMGRSRLKRKSTDEFDLKDLNLLMK